MRVLSQLANYWKCLGCDISFVSFYESENPYYPVDVKMIWIDDSGNELSENNSKHDAKNSGFKRMYALYKYLKMNSFKYDIILANHNLTAWSVCIGSKTRNFYYIQAYEVGFSSRNSLCDSLKRMGRISNLSFTINKNS